VRKRKFIIISASTRETMTKKSRSTLASSHFGLRPIGTPPCSASGTGVCDGKYFPVQVSGVELALKKTMGLTSRKINS